MLVVVSVKQPKPLRKNAVYENNPRPHQATAFEMFMARLIGTKFLAEDSGCFIVGYHYKGKTYLDQYYSLEAIKKKPKESS
jgi:hypothetical protein